MAYVLEMVSRRGSLLKIIMIITYLQYSSRRSLMIEEEVEGMTCDLMAIARGGGGCLEEEVHYSFMMNGNRVRHYSHKTSPPRPAMSIPVSSDASQRSWPQKILDKCKEQPFVPLGTFSPHYS